jgi:lipopolysaccharide export system protein LptA
MIRNLFLFAIAVVLSIGPSHAQLIASSDEPIDITGDAAEFNDNIAVWTGNVRVVQGEAILTADRLEAKLNDQRQFQSIVALGAVRYSNGQEAITGERADYDDAARTITISENVIVTQGKQVMSAGAVTYWIDTGRIKFAPEPGKRIRGIFYTGKDEQT